MVEEAKLRVVTSNGMVTIKKGPNCVVVDNQELREFVENLIDVYGQISKAKGTSS
jgi:hypothetical protein